MDEIKKITEPILLELNLFEDKLKAIIECCDNFLKPHLETFVFSSPKRLRPIFIFLFSKILKIKDENVLNIALVSELIHTASLIHDDILDEEKLRRNNKTFYNKFGSKLSVLEGDLLLGLALNILSKTSIDITKIYSDNILKTINGEINQNSIKNKIPSEEFYLNSIMDKTSNLFISGLQSLFTLQNTDEEIKTSLVNFMKQYSIAFQIENDIDNILNKNSTDIKNGNYTLPVIYFCMENSIEDINDYNIEKFTKSKEKYIEITKRKIKTYKENALAYLENIQESKFKDSIINITNYTIKE